MRVTLFMISAVMTLLLLSVPHAVPQEKHCYEHEARLLGIAHCPKRCCCRASWDDRSHSLVLLLSLLTGIIWAVAWMNIVAHCRWSRLLCGAAQLACASMVSLQACIQVNLSLALPAFCQSEGLQTSQELLRETL